MQVTTTELQTAKEYLAQVKPCLYSTKQEAKLDELKAAYILVYHNNNLKQEFNEAQKHWTEEDWQECDAFSTPATRQEWINRTLQNYYQ